MIPGINLDYCLVALGSDKEVKEIVIHVTRKLPQVQTFDIKVKAIQLKSEEQRKEKDLYPLKPCEIPWIDREDCGDDIGCSSSKDLDDILRQYAKDNRVEAESHKAKLGEVEKEVDTKIDSDDDTEDEGDNHIEFEVSDDIDGFVMSGLLR
ncbi:hypothetical protein Tco_1344097 [Tanacetum coccineum]